LSQTDDLDASAKSWIVPDERPVTLKGQRTRERLVQAADKLFRDRGYKEVSVPAIAQAAGVSIGTFYRYFENKEELFTLLLSRVFWSMYQATRGMWDRSASLQSNFERVTHSYLLAYWKNRKLLHSAFELVALSESVRKMWWSMRRDLYGRMLERLQEDQTISDLPALDPLISIRALGGMVDEYARRAFADEEWGPMTLKHIDAASEVLGAIWFRALFRTRGP
jgi:AcrR family transcriptional regulator